MDFEWDEDKSKINKTKHGIDFESAKNLWLEEGRVEIHAPYPLENRSNIIAAYQNKIWTAIYTLRDDTVRIISVRRARKREADLYEKEEVSNK
jgi:uncharacterized DUF497 family protein